MRHIGKLSPACHRLTIREAKNITPHALDSGVDTSLTQIYPSIRMNGLTTASAPPDPGVLDQMAVLGDPVRCRILLLCESDELTDPFVFARCELRLSLNW